MTERVKTIVLVALIVLSLYQSYLLAYSKPDFDPISQDEYIETEWIGDQRELDQLIFPWEIVLHLGDNRHTVFYPNFNFYHMIFDKVRQRTLASFREVNASNLDFTAMRERQQGIEIRFKQSVPLSFLQNVMEIRMELIDVTDSIDRIWITIPEVGEEVRTFLFSRNDQQVYEATHVDLTVRDVEEFVGFGEYMPAYTAQRNGEYYIPLEPIETVEFKMSVLQYSPEQLQKSLFVDPAISRNLLERDGTEIYTDGKRGLQISQSQRWMSYSDPVAPVESPADVWENLYTAIKFINRHGGWNGQYLLFEAIPGTTQTYKFQQYVQPVRNYNAFPILSTRTQPFGQIEVSVQRGTITNYERSILELEKEVFDVKPMVLPGGDSLRALLNQFGQRHLIRSVFPAYAPRLTEKGMQLTPRWAVLLENQSYEFLH